MINVSDIIESKDLSMMEKMLIIQNHKDEIDLLTYLLAMTYFDSASYYCNTCGIYYDYDKCEIQEITKEVATTPAYSGSTVFIPHTESIKTISLKTIKCPLKHKSILEHN